MQALDTEIQFLWSYIETKRNYQESLDPKYAAMFQIL